MARLRDRGVVVAGVVADEPGASSFEGVPRVTPAAFASLEADVLVLSSRTFEAALAEKARRWLPGAIPLVRLYTTEASG
jgi:hypothetical protein